MGARETNGCRPYFWFALFLKPLIVAAAISGSSPATEHGEAIGGTIQWFRGHSH